MGRQEGFGGVCHLGRRGLSLQYLQPTDKVPRCTCLLVAPRERGVTAFSWQIVLSLDRPRRRLPRQFRAENICGNSCGVRSLLDISA